MKTDRWILLNWFDTEVTAGRVSEVTTDLSLNNM